LVTIAIDCPSQAELAVFGHGVDQHLAFGINQKSIALWRVRAGALRGVHRDLPWNVTVVQERRSYLGKLLVSDCDGRDDAFAFALFDQFKIARNFIDWKR